VVKLSVLKSILTILLGIIIGVVISYELISDSSLPLPESITNIIPTVQKKEVIGFLPYWLIDKATKDYSKYINTLTYFGIEIENDGSITKLVNDVETEPGWNALTSGKMDPFFETAKKNKMKLSLLIFKGNEASISALIEDPEPHAKKLVEEVVPVMKKYGFSDLNLDIESVNVASDESRINFTKFVKEVSNGLKSKKAGTLSIEVSPTVFIKKYLINAVEIAQYVDAIVVMAYDYHYQGSQVTGPVAPLAGADTVAEFDTEKGIEEALKKISPDKIILGIPLYGYEWETIVDSPRSAVIPGSGVTASNARVDTLLSTCASCSAQLDSDAKESYLIYKDTATNAYHQIFYPDQKATEAKVEYAKKMRLAGIAMWALGYDGKTILDPLKSYK
jgi:spore germination protein